jgi:hypothetical protein
MIRKHAVGQHVLEHAFGQFVTRHGWTRGRFRGLTAIPRLCGRKREQSHPDQNRTEQLIDTHRDEYELRSGIDHRPQPPDPVGIRPTRPRPRSFAYRHSG